jgi:hypothetical protein
VILTFARAFECSRSLHHSPSSSSLSRVTLVSGPRPAADTRSLHTQFFGPYPGNVMGRINLSPILDQSPSSPPLQPLSHDGTSSITPQSRLHMLPWLCPRTYMGGRERRFQSQCLSPLYFVPHSGVMRSTFVLLALAVTTLAARSQRRSCSYSCPEHDVFGGPLVTGFAVFGQLQCTYFAGVCTYSAVSVLHLYYTPSWC